MASSVDQICPHPPIISLFLSDLHPSFMKPFLSPPPPPPPPPSRISTHGPILEESFTSAAAERPVKLPDPLRIGHSMGSPQTLDVAPCTPLPSFPKHRPHLHEVVDASPSPPSLCLSVGPPASLRGKRDSHRSTKQDMASSSQPSSRSLSAHFSPNGTEDFDLASSGLRSEAHGAAIGSLPRVSLHSEGRYTIARELSLGFIGAERHQPKDAGSQSSAILFGACLVSRKACDAQLSEEKGGACGQIVTESDGKTTDSIHTDALTSEAGSGTSETSSFELRHGRISYDFSGMHFSPVRGGATYNGISHHQKQASSHTGPVAKQQFSCAFGSDVLASKEDCDDDGCGPVQRGGRPKDFCMQKRKVIELGGDRCQSGGGKEIPEKRCKLLLSGGDVVRGMQSRHGNEAMVKEKDVANQCEGWEHSDSAGKDDPYGLLQQLPGSKPNADHFKLKLEAPNELSTGADKHCILLEVPQNGRKMEPSQSIAVDKVAAADGDWGKFLALSATPTDASDETRSKMVVPPFLHRFRLLQEFLKQCDQPDPKYDLQALQILSAAEIGSHTIVLEDRAAKLSLEENRELDRMMLNVLG